MPSGKIIDDDIFVGAGISGLSKYSLMGKLAGKPPPSGQSQVWNRIPDDIRQRIVELALDETDMSPRELAVYFTDMEQYFISEGSVIGCLNHAI